MIMNEEVLDSCNNVDNQFTLIDDVAICVSQPYSRIFDEQVGYYQRLLSSLTITPGSDYELKTGCILPSTQKFNQVTVAITSVDIPLYAIKKIVLQNALLQNSTCSGACMNSANPRIDLPGTDICNIYIEVETDEKTENTFSVQFDIMISNQMLFSGLLVSRKNYADSTYHFCSGAQFIGNPSYIKNNLEYDKLQKFVSEEMCTGRDYYIE
jgi:hypothetical protein